MTKPRPAALRILASGLLLGACALQAQAADTPSLIPLPAHYETVAGKDFVLKPSARVAGNDEVSQRVATQFVQLLAQNGATVLV